MSGHPDTHRQDPLSDSILVRKAADGDGSAMNVLFDRCSDRLRTMVRLSLNPRLQRRLDASDIFQDACVEASSRLNEYLKDPPLSFYLWMRRITQEKMIDAHRRHIGAQRRDASREVHLHGGNVPGISSDSLADRIVSRVTPPERAAQRNELLLLVRDAIEDLEPIDREILVMRHFEQLSTNETAELLGLSKTGASSRYVRALERLKHVLARFPGLLESRS